MANETTIEPEFLDLRLKVGGEEGKKLRKFLTDKMKKDRRKSLSNTVEAILLDLIS